MSQDVKCFFGLHKREVIQVYDKLDPRGNVIGKVYVNRCTNCGKLKIKTVYTGCTIN